MSIKDCIKQLKTLDPADAAVFEAHRKTLNEGGVKGGEAYTQAAELTMESILGERNELATEIKGKGGFIKNIDIENLLNPESYGRATGELRESYEEAKSVKECAGDECFKNAAKYAGSEESAVHKQQRAEGAKGKLDDVGYKVIHGMVTNIEGKRFAHAWVETPDGEIHDPTTGVTMDKDHYYELLDALETAVYTSEQASLNAARTKNWGPWTEEEVEGRITTAKEVTEITEQDDFAFARKGKDDPSTRRTFLKSVLSVAAVGGAVRLGMGPTDLTTLGRAVVIPDEAVDQQVPASAEKILRADGSLPEVMRIIAAEGPKELRELASTLSKLIPTGKVKIVVDDTTVGSISGAVLPGNKGAVMTLYTAGDAGGLSVGTVLHESLHAAIAARYYTLSVASIGRNYKRVGMSRPQAMEAIRQLTRVWDEFYDAVDSSEITNTALAAAIRNPDEFFVRALTDPTVQEFMAGKEYKGKTLLERFIEWIKVHLFGYKKTGEVPSWLDAGLMAANDVLTAMAADKPNFTFSGKVIKSVNKTDDTDAESFAFARRPKADLKNEIPGLKQIWSFLTKPERAKLNRQTAAKLVKIFESIPDAKEMAAVAYSGRAKKGWYKNSAQAIVDIFGVVDAPRFAALLAALSPMTDVETNALNALNVWADWTSYGGIDHSRDRPTDRDSILEILGRSVQGDRGIDSVLKAWRNNSVRALSSEDPESLVISGPKVNSFMLNLRGYVNEVANDTWMGLYASLSEQDLKGSLTKRGDPGKRPGYMAMVAKIRKAARIVSQRTGKPWSASEVQETVWSWVKTIYEMAASADEKRSVVELLKAGGLTHEDIADAVDFEALFTKGVYRKILEGAGYAKQVKAVERIAKGRKKGGRRARETGDATSSKGSGITDASFQRHLRRAGRRLEKARQEGREETPPLPESDQELESYDTSEDEFFQGRGVTSHPPAGSSVATVKGWLKGPIRRIKGVNIEIVADPQSLRVRYPNREIPDNAAGLFIRRKDGGKIFIVASNIRNKSEAHLFLAHELVGHLGLEKLLGPERFDQLLAEIAHIKTEAMLSPGSHPEVEAVMAFIKRVYVDEDGDYNLDTKMEAREILAHLAGDRPRIGFWVELYNKILNWVRNALNKLGLNNVTRVKVGRGNESIEDLLEVAVQNLRGKAPTRATPKPEVEEDLSLARTDKAPKSRKGLGHKEASKRIPELQNSMAELMSGKAAISEYDRMVNEHKPVDPYDEVPTPATPAEMRKALSSNKIERIGTPAKELADGAPVGLRLDIPAYTNHGVWVVSVHGQTGGFDAGKVYGYDNVAMIKNATFGSREKTAQKVAAGGPKSTMAVIKGEWVPTTKGDAHNLALKSMLDDNWTQVGFDPERHSYFWDRHDMRPVVAADEVVQIGPLVMAKNPKYAPKDDFLYARTTRKPRKKQNGAAYRTAAAVRGAYDQASTPLKRQIWGLLSLRQIAEQIRPLIPTIHEDFLRYYSRMETVRNVFKSRAGDIAGQRRKLNNFENDQLSRVQHESTIAGVDGDVPYEALIDEVEAAEQIKVINEQMRGRTGQDNSALMAKRKAVQEMLAQEKNRRKVSRFIQTAFNKLNTKQVRIYRLERNYHVDLRDEVRQALLDRIEEAFVDESIKGDMMSRLQIEFEAASVQPPYFPLARFGQFWVYSELDGEPYFDMFETEGEWKRHHRDMKEAGAKILGAGKNQNDAKPKQEIPPVFIARVDKIISRLGDHPRIGEIRDQIYQLYLESLPELSARKHALHRSKMRGFYKDHLRAFAAAAQHGSNMLARIKYSHKMQAVLDDAQLSLDMASTAKIYNQIQEELDAYNGYLDENIDDLTEGEIKTEAARLRKAAELEAAEQTEFEPGEGSAALYKRWLMYLNIKREVSGRPNSPTGSLPTTPEEAVQERIRRRSILVGMADNINRQKDPLNARRQVSDVLAELRRSLEGIVNPNVAGWANNINALGFVWYLGFTPAAGVVNLFQTPVIALPVAAARFGWGPMSKHMGQITVQINGQMRKNKAHPYFSVEKLLKNEGEVAAFQSWHDEGMLDKTLAHDLQGISEEGIYTGQVKHRVMNAASFIFHQAERMNREVTALAVYRAAIDKGMTPRGAAKAAEFIVWKSHYDYSMGNRPRVMRGNAMRVITQFKQYSQNITYLYYRTVQQAFGTGTKENKEARAEGRRMLFGLLLMQFLAAGILGWPLVELGIMLAQMFDDDDEANDYKGEFQQWSHDNIGPVMGEAFTKGVPNALGIDMHARLTLSDLWWRTSDRELQGSRRREEITKAMFGPPASILIDMQRGAEQMAEAQDFWEYMRAIETAGPKIFKDISKGARYGIEGVKSFSGADIIPSDDISKGDVVKRALGFSPSDISQAYDAKGAIERVATRRRLRKGQLSRRQVALVETKIRADREGLVVDGLLGKIAENQFKIDRWNALNPQNQINTANIKKTVKIRLDEGLQSKYGVPADKVTRDLLNQYNFGGQ